VDIPWFLERSTRITQMEREDAITDDCGELFSMMVRGGEEPTERKGAKLAILICIWRVV
jgi:hypothetical protein